jgi:hypothetical protein
VITMAIFPSQVVELPMKYLGIPLTIRKVPKSALQPLVDKVANMEGLANATQWPINSDQNHSISHSCVHSDQPRPAIMVDQGPDKIIHAFLWCGTDEI